MYISYRPLTLILLRVIVTFNPYGFYVSSSVLSHCSIKHDDDTTICNIKSVLLCISPLMGTLKPQSNGPLYSNTVIPTLAVDGWAVTFGTARPRPVRCTSICHTITNNWCQTQQTSTRTLLQGLPPGEFNNVIPIPLPTCPERFITIAVTVSPYCCNVAYITSIIHCGA